MLSPDFRHREVIKKFNPRQPRDMDGKWRRMRPVGGSPRFIEHMRSIRESNSVGDLQAVKAKVDADTTLHPDDKKALHHQIRTRTVQHMTGRRL